MPVRAGEGADRPADDCGDAIIEMLRMRARPDVSHWLGHDLITGPAAEAAARRYGGKTIIIHHMDYIAYQNLGGGRGSQTVDNQRRQIALFEAADFAFGVGARLAKNARYLGAKHAQTIVPGFPEIMIPSDRKSDSLRAIIAGRFDEKSEPVKQVDLVVNAFGRAIREAGTLVPSLSAPSLTLLGVEAERAAKMERAATSKAGRSVNLVPASFNTDPKAFATHCSRANLAIMASRHEGFGLVGWEAIGTGTPLILGDDTGLTEQLRETLPTTCDSLVTIVAMGQGYEDVEANLAKEIINVSGNIPLALQKAKELRQALVNELGCTWDEAARRVLDALRLPVELPRLAAHSRPALREAVFDCRPTDHFPDCVELALSAGQGATQRSIELIAELRFGKAELDLGGIAAEIALRAARLRVVTESGRLEGARLGDDSRPAVGMEARAGGVWAFAAEKGERLPNKALGNEALCRIEAPLGTRLSASVEVTGAKRDLECKIYRSGKRPSPTKARIMELFLKNAIFKEDSGHILFSVAFIEERYDANE